MRAEPLAGRRGFAAALARAEAWLLEPAGAAEVEPDSVRDAPAAAEPRPVVAVIGLAPRCGATTVARGLAAQLAARDPAGAAVVSCARAAVAPLLRTPAAGRLGRALEERDLTPLRSCGRICLVADEHEQAAAASARRLAPVVLDSGFGRPPAAAAELADHLVVVAAEDTFPPLAEVVAASLGEGGRPVQIVVNRCSDEARWGSRTDAFLPDARLGAQLAVSGREPPGAFGSALTALADRVGR